MACSGKHELHFKVALLGLFIYLFLFGNKQVFDFLDRDSFFGPAVREDIVRGAMAMYPK